MVRLTGARVVIAPGRILASATVVLRDGVIAAVGTHRELLSANPEYRALLASTDEEVRT